MVGHSLGGYYLHMRMKSGDCLPHCHHLTSQLGVFAAWGIGSAIGSVGPSGYEAEDGSIVESIEGDEEVALIVVGRGVALQSGRLHGILLRYLG